MGERKRTKRLGSMGGMHIHTYFFSGKSSVGRNHPLRAKLIPVYRTLGPTSTVVCSRSRGYVSPFSGEPCLDRGWMV